MKDSLTRTRIVVAAAALSLISIAFSQRPTGDKVERYKTMSKQAEERGLADPYKGITTSGTPQPGLFAIRSSGVSTEPVRKAAMNFLQALTPDQRKATKFPVDDPEWRKWMNQHFYVRQGIGFIDMTDAQRESAFGLMRASLSAKGLKLSRDIMKLNHTLGELNNGNFSDYGEWFYYITIMGEPSAKDPWGWQVDGHHLIINYFVLGDQVVMTPTFVGSEPVIAKSGKYEGTVIMQTEQNKGLAFVNSLNEVERKKAIIEVSKTGNNNIGEAFKDNVVLAYAGVPASELSPKQQTQLLDLVQEYVDNMDSGHARVKMDEVRKHIRDTHFAWIGGTEPDSVFYYRIHSPVILIEFDHQLPVGLPNMDRKKPAREHIHAVVRTPNGNDYGKDLLRQHYAQHAH